MPSYASGETLYYSIAIHSNIGGKATLDTTAEAAIAILAGAAPGRFDAEARFTRFTTAVQADPDDLAALKKQSSDTDQAATSMGAARFRMTAGQFTVISRPNGPQFDEPVEMLEELVRTDALPTAPVTVGEHWTRTRTRAIPTLEFSVPLTLDCVLTELAPVGSVRAATVTVHTTGHTPLPPGSLPGSQELAAQGLVAEAAVGFDTTATAHYRLPDSVLLESTSENHNSMQIKLVGPSPHAGTTNTDIDSTSTVKLERIAAPDASHRPTAPSRAFSALSSTVPSFTLARALMITPGSLSSIPYQRVIHPTSDSGEAIASLQMRSQSNAGPMRVRQLFFASTRNSSSFPPFLDEGADFVTIF